jgi:hypothetical protein
MSGKRRIVIHVGIHKTGSTSIQGFLHAHREALRRLDVDFYSGAYNESNHVELHAAAMRCERTSPWKLGVGLEVDGTFREAVQQRVHQYIAESHCGCIVFSAEGLSYLRYEDEMNRLRNMIPEGRIEIVVYVRDPASFLASYKRELKKHVVPVLIDEDSFAYTGDDSWLVDFDKRIDGFRDAFGGQNVIVIDYDHELRTSGNVIPSFLRVLGVESHFSSADWSSFFLNRTRAMNSPMIWRASARLWKRWR